MANDGNTKQFIIDQLARVADIREARIVVQKTLDELALEPACRAFVLKKFEAVVDQIGPMTFSASFPAEAKDALDALQQHHERVRNVWILQAFAAWIELWRAQHPDED